MVPYNFIAGMILILFAAIGWLGYFLEFTKNQKLPENIRKIYYNEN